MSVSSIGLLPGKRRGFHHRGRTEERVDVEKIKKKAYRIIADFFA
jgi:hypothetical protein